jgi:hypothetical protein
MSTTTPEIPFGAQLIGRTEKTLDVLLKRVLAGSGLREPEYVALRVCADRAGAPRTEVTAQLAGAFHKGEEHAACLLERLAAEGVIGADETAPIELTPVGRELHARLVAETDAIATSLWGDLPRDDLAVATRVLTTVLRRGAAAASAGAAAPALR